MKRQGSLDLEAHALYLRYHAVYSDLYAATVQVMHRLADLSMYSG